MKIVLTISLILLSILSNAQTVLLMHDVENEKESDIGPGKTHHSGSITVYGLVVGPSESDSLNIEYGKSYQFGLGHFYRYQVAKFLAFGYSSLFNIRSYRISQKAPKIYASPTEFKWEKYYNINVDLSLFMRINFTKRGNHNGGYIDLCGYGGYNFINRHSYRIDLPYPSPNESVKVVNRGLQYVNRIEYGTMARLGYKNLFIYGQYRLSNHFTTFENSRYPELPRYVVGIGISG